jgi:hypothetical protein
MRIIASQRAQSRLRDDTGASARLCVGLHVSLFCQADGTGPVMSLASVVMPSALRSI